MWKRPSYEGNFNPRSCALRPKQLPMLESLSKESACAVIPPCLPRHSRPSRECINLFLLAVAPPLYGG